MVKLFRVLRIISCLLSAAAAAACVLVFVLLHDTPIWGIITIIIGAIFFVLMIIFKRLEEDAGVPEADEKPRGDFITGPVTENKEDKDE